MDWSYYKDLFIGIFYNRFLLCLPTYLGLFSFVALLLYPQWEDKMKSKLLLKARKYAILILMGFILISVVLTSHQLYKNKQPNFATPDELIQLTLRDRDIRLADLTREDFTIRNKTFDNCHIYGPAVIYPKNLILMGKMSTGANYESGFIATTNKTISGAVVLEGCVMKDCALYKISFIGSPEQIADIKVKLKLKDQ